MSTKCQNLILSESTLKMNKKSTANMARRKAPLTSLDYFPTPPHATHKLIRILTSNHKLHKMTCLEPAAGGGHMAEVLNLYFRFVKCSDIQDPSNKGWGGHDFLLDHHEPESYDWVITNPPFKLAEEFCLKSFSAAKTGVAMLCRLQFLEGLSRHKKLFSTMPPSKVYVFSRRINMVEERLWEKGDDTSATCYAWFVWEKESNKPETKLFWI